MHRLALPLSKSRLVATFFCVFLTGCRTDAFPPTSHFVVASGSVQSASLSPQSNLALIGSRNHGMSLWRTADQERLFDWRHHEDRPTELAAADFAAAAPYALTAEEKTLSLWHTETGRAERFWSAPDVVLALQLSADSKTALLGLKNDEAVLFNVQQGGVLRSFKHSMAVSSVALREASNTALTGSIDGKAASWNTATGKKTAEVKHDDVVVQAALSPDGLLAFTVGKRDRALLWHSQSGEIIKEIDLRAVYLKPGQDITAVAFSEDGRHLLLGQSGQEIVLWQLEPWQRLAVWKLPRTRRWPPSKPTLLDVGYGSGDGQYLAVASDGKLYHLRRPLN